MTGWYGLARRCTLEHVSEYAHVPPPPDWPTGLPAPSSRDLPAAVVRWLWDAVPADQWRHGALGDWPWMLVMMATTTIRRQLDDLRASWTDIPTYAGILDPDTIKDVRDAHEAEARRLTALLAQLDQVGMELLHGPTKGGRLKPGK